MANIVVDRCCGVNIKVANIIVDPLRVSIVLQCYSYILLYFILVYNT